MLLQSLDGDGEAQLVWLRNGGATLLAEGLDEGELNRAAARQPGTLGGRRIAFLETLRPWQRVG